MTTLIPLAALILFTLGCAVVAVTRPPGPTAARVRAAVYVVVTVAVLGALAPEFAAWAFDR